MELSPGFDVETKLFAKAGVADHLDRELARPKYQVAPIELGTNSDRYPAIQRRYKTTRQILESILDTIHPVILVAEVALIEGDIDQLSLLTDQGSTLVGIFLPNFERTLSICMESYARAPKMHLALIQRLSDMVSFFRIG